MPLERSISAKMSAGKLRLMGRSSGLFVNRDKICPQCLGPLRCYSDSAKSKDGGAENNGPRISRRQHEKMLDRDFFLSVFSTSATKRDAKAYLSRYKEEEKAKAVKKAPVKPQQIEVEREERLQKSGVNLGGLYGQARAIEQSPVFTQQELPDRYATDASGPIHMAVVKVRGIDELDEQTRTGVALTLAQLARLGLLSCVVVEGSTKTAAQSWIEWRRATIKSCFKLANAINAQSKTGARVLDQALGICADIKDIPSVVPVKGEVNVAMHENLLATLRHGFIPIVPPVAYTKDLRAQRIEADEAVLALTRELAGLSRPVDERLPSPEPPTTVDKVIILDPLGGLPAVDKADQSHIFVNLEQEYQNVRSELLQLDQVVVNQQLDSAGSSTTVDAVDSAPQPNQLEQHIKNLDLLKKCLTLLPPASSALLTTPSEAASSALFSSVPTAGNSSGPGVGTRAKRNPLIHNLLTDKPTISSSLPTSRMASPSNFDAPVAGFTRFTPATFFKRGMPLTIIPDPKISPWIAPGPEGSTLRLESDPRIDFPRLLNLIEDSFGRPLDVQHYLDRIKGRIAGIIVAGEYEGGAILTWEYPPSTTSGPRPAVPYLDKFAVLRKSQGSGGVADIVFNAMVRTCLPNGVVWRSRKNNPVNKWYFERSVGTWKLPDTQWCMFWTGKDVDHGNTPDSANQRKKERWNDFVAVCSGIEASWADGDKKAPD